MTQERDVYDGPEGRIIEQNIYGRLQYRAGGKYFGTQRAARAHLNKRHAALAQKQAAGRSIRLSPNA